MNHELHVTLQGKGGVGKSFVAALVTQHLLKRKVNVIAIDTDPTNETLMGYKSIGAKRLELMKGTVLDERKFDELIEEVIETDASFVVDNGSSSFISLSNYLVENQVFNVLGESGRQVVVHCVVVGGQALADTLQGFNSLAQQLPQSARLIVWLNEYFGPIEYNEKQFEDMLVYTSNREKVHGIMRIPALSSATFGKDMQLMMARKLTFADIQADTEFGLMAKSRLASVARGLFAQMDTVL